jgi:hypothetical protein
MTTPLTRAKQAIAIVADPNDDVAIKVGLALESRGHEVVNLDGPSAARTFTTSLQEGVAQVHPKLPIFLRASAWWATSKEYTLDQGFLLEENYGALWAATALSSAVVVNRPRNEPRVEALGVGSIHHLFGSHAVAPRKVQSHARFNQAEVRANCPNRVRLKKPGQSLWGRNIDGLSAPLEELPFGVPLRARAFDIDEAYEIIAVVGERAFPATCDPATSELGLEGRTVKLAQLAGLQFATVWWAVSQPGALAVRIDPNPAFEHIVYSWPDVQDALCTELAS